LERLEGWVGREVGGSMRMFAARRWMAGVLTLVAAAGVVAWLMSYPSPRAAAYDSGWLLAGTMVLLALYNVRKKLPYPPLLSSSAWLQVHVYVGLLSVVVFLGHIGMRWPTGAFEVTLAGLYVLVAGTGVLGIVISRLIPKRLTATGAEVLYERVPIARRELRERAEGLALASVRESNKTTLSDFYRDRLAVFFREPRHRWQHLLRSSRPRQRLETELRSLGRYLDERERAVADELAELIEAKDDLDRHWAMQGLLKGWLFVHIPLTYALLISTAAHVALVYGFVGEGG